jgi:hypothetical protein
MVDVKESESFVPLCIWRAFRGCETAVTAMRVSLFYSSDKLVSHGLNKISHDTMTFGAIKLNVAHVRPSNLALIAESNVHVHDHIAPVTDHGVAIWVFVTNCLHCRWNVTVMVVMTEICFANILRDFVLAHVGRKRMQKGMVVEKAMKRSRE